MAAVGMGEQGRQFLVGSICGTKRTSLGSNPSGQDEAQHAPADPAA